MYRVEIARSLRVMLYILSENGVVVVSYCSALILYQVPGIATKATTAAVYMDFILLVPCTRGQSTPEEYQ